MHTEAGLKWLCAKYIYFYIDKINTSWWGIYHFLKGYMYKIWVFLKDCGVQRSILSLEVICGIHVLIMQYFLFTVMVRIRQDTVREGCMGVGHGQRVEYGENQCISDCGTWYHIQKLRIYHCIS